MEKFVSIDDFAAVVAFNNKGEQEALEGYFKLLALAKQNGLPAAFIEQVEEIISDEMNHAKKLSEWMTRLTGIRPAKD